MLDPSQCNYLGRIRRCNLVGGGVSLGVGWVLRFKKPSLSLPPTFESRYKLSVVPATMALFYHNGLWNGEP